MGDTEVKTEDTEEDVCVETPLAFAFSVSSVFLLLTLVSVR